MTRIRAVTFDVGGTLIEPWPSVGHIYSEVAAEFGLWCDAESLNHGFANAWRRKSDFGYSRAEWFDLVRLSFAAFGEVSLALFDAIYDRFAGESCWKIYEDVLPALNRLRSSGFRLAIISNWDERLMPLLDRLQLKAYFEEVLVSSAIGAHKPARAIFSKAADHFGLPPNEILHIGDSETEDVRGALAAGFHARRIRRAGPLGRYDLASLSEIPGDAIRQTLPHSDKEKEQTRTSSARLAGG